LGSKLRRSRCARIEIRCLMLQALQNQLASIYDVPQSHDVAEFLLTDRNRLPAALRGSGADEQVFVAEDGDTLWITLFLEPSVLQRLASANPLEALNAGNIADYWTALEGVSHFVCVAWHAAQDRPVTLLELELQGEIDKYVSTLWLLRSQDPERFPIELHKLLFESARVDPTLAGDRVGLYRHANAYAARFCRRLARMLRPDRPASLVAAISELRRFYRLSRERKLRYIDCLV
jgi:hypothetical protein